MNYKKGTSDITFGGGWNRYDGDHYGNVIWGEMLGETDPGHEWYRNNGLKEDFNLYGKYQYQLTGKVSLFADVQYRGIDYEIDGIDDDLRDISQEHMFRFFNPKAGIFYEPVPNQKVYFSFATANREPNRTAFVDISPEKPAPSREFLHDWEMGYNYSSSGFTASANLYYMNYKDQLVLTGEINDVGNPIMVNVDKSYRTGIELQTGVIITQKLQWQGNATFSRNKILNFTEYVDNWNTWRQESFDLGTTDIAFSPNVIANSRFRFEPVRRLSLSLISSYTGKQYIDNSSSDDRKLDPWFVNNLKASYTIQTNLAEEVTLRLLVNNLFNHEYESNAWVYSYILDGQRYKMDGYFPQAGRHYMIGLNFRF